MNNIFITDFLTITELSRLTKKSRPTIYKYLNEYNSNNYDEIPFSFIKLFEMSKSCSKSEIEYYCELTYGKSNTFNSNANVQEIIDLIIKNQIHLDTNKLKTFILKELEK